MKIIVTLLVVFLSVVISGCTPIHPDMINPDMINNSNSSNSSLQTCVDCAAPPLGCSYSGGSCTSCGSLVCDGSQGIPINPASN